MLSSIIKEWKELITDKRIWIGIMIVLIIVIIGTSYNIKKPSDITVEGGKLLRLGVINKDDSPYSDLLLTYFSDSDTFSSMIKVVTDEERVILEAFSKNELDILIEIPEDFAENMIKIEHSPVNVKINIEDTTKAILVQNLLQSYEKYIAAVELSAVGLYEIMELDGMDQDMINKANTAISLDLIFTALGKEAFFSFHEIDTFPASKIRDYYLISILIIALMYGGLYVGFGIIREKSQGTLSRIMTTQLNLYKYLLAKIVTYLVLMMTISITSLFIYSKSMLQGIPIVGIGLLGSMLPLFFLILFIFLSAIFTTPQRYILVGNLLILYCLVIGGGIIPIQFLPQDIIRLSKLTPNYYILEGIFRMKQSDMTFTYGLSLMLFTISILLFILTLLIINRRRGQYEQV